MLNHRVKNWNLRQIREDKLEARFKVSVRITEEEMLKSLDSTGKKLKLSFSHFSTVSGLTPGQWRIIQSTHSSHR